MRERAQFLGAIEARLKAMQFGLFAGGSKRYRDQVAEAVATCAREAKGIETQLSNAHQALSDKLSEVQDKLDDLQRST